MCFIKGCIYIRLSYIIRHCFPLLHPMQNKVVFVNVFDFFCLGSCKTAADRLKYTASMFIFLKAGLAATVFKNKFIFIIYHLWLNLRELGFALNMADFTELEST